MKIPSIRCSAFRFSSGVRGVFFAAVLFLAPPIAFAQHGGGHAGGGAHSGGGGHVGGAGHAPSAPHVASPPAYRAPAARPPVGAPLVATTPRVITVPPRSFAAPRSNQFGAPVVGNHILMPPVAPGAASSGHAVIGYPSAPPPGWRVTNVTGPTMRFEGQRDEIWQSPAGEALGQSHRRPIGGPIVRPIGPPVFGPGFGFRGGFPIYGGPFFGSGLWFGSGWGPTCGPYWGWGLGCNGLAYYDYGYGYGSGYGGYGYVGPPVSNWPSSDYGSQPETPPEPDNGPFIYESQTPEQAQENIRAESFVTVLYLKDGEVYALNNYWVEDGKLHYVSGDAVEHTVDIDQIDVQKTVDVNASRGVNFTLRPKDSGYAQPGVEPNAPGNAPDAQPPASPNEPNSPPSPQNPPGGNPQP